jgi:hypothetical protein
MDIQVSEVEEAYSNSLYSLASPRFVFCTGASKTWRRPWFRLYLVCGLVAKTKSVGGLAIWYIVVSEPVSDGSQRPLNSH